MISNEEIIFKEHDLKLAIQKEIMDNYSNVLSTRDIGYTSWQIATQVVEKQKEDKQKTKQKTKGKKFNKILKILLDKTEIKL